MGQKERNKATEVVDGVVETVDVSKHPTASIEPSDLSLADIERRKSHPVRWILFMALVLLAMIAPYWWGRDIAVRDASWMVANLNFLDPKGVALISWTVTIVALTGLGLMVADAKKWLWGTIFVIGLAAEQFVAGMCLLSFNFWNATYVMYGEAAGLANAANLGIIAAGFGVAFNVSAGTSMPAASSSSVLQAKDLLRNCRTTPSSPMLTMAAIAVRCA